MAIKANELRIGNWILFRNHLQPERYIQVNARFFSSLAGGRSINEIKPDEELNLYYSGIALTPEILEKCGFVRREFGYRTDGLFLFFSNGVFTYNADIEIKSVHQLQNLYFALTGEELEINL